MSRALAAFMFSLLLLPSASRGDQLAWISGEDADKAVKFLQDRIAQRKGEPYYIVSYCSQCDQERIEVWEVAKAVKEAIPNEDFFQVRISGRRVLRSAELIREGKYSEPIHYEATAGDAADLIHQEVDLAYIYAPSPDGSFQCLGKTLGLECQVQVERINIPKEPLWRTGNKPVEKAGPPKTFKDAVFASMERISGKQCVVVVLEDDGTATLAGRPVTIKELSGLKAVEALPDGFGVCLKVSPASRQQQVVECLDALAKQGLHEIIVTSE